MAAKGIRLCNPANIRKGSNWKGLSAVQTDKSFCQFKSMAWGVRALIYLLRRYVQSYNLRSVRKIISRWAPPQDNNNTEAYIKFVVDNVSYCFNADQEFLSARDFDIDYQEGCWKVFYLCKAMCKIETGYYLDYQTFLTALALL